MLAGFSQIFRSSFLFVSPLCLELTLPYHQFDLLGLCFGLAQFGACKIFEISFLESRLQLFHKHFLSGIDLYLRMRLSSIMLNIRQPIDFLSPGSSISITLTPNGHLGNGQTLMIFRPRMAKKGNQKLAPLAAR